MQYHCGPSIFRVALCVCFVDVQWHSSSGRSGLEESRQCSRGQHRVELWTLGWARFVHEEKLISHYVLLPLQQLCKFLTAQEKRAVPMHNGPKVRRCTARQRKGGTARGHSGRGQPRVTLRLRRCQRGASTFPWVCEATYHPQRKPTALTHDNITAQTPARRRPRPRSRSR